MSKLSLVAALALGGLVACSTLVMAQDAPKEGKKGGKRGFPTVEQQMDKLTTELSLTDDQKPKVKAVLEGQQKQFQDLRNDSSLDRDARREKMQTIHKDTVAKMKPILTDDQFKKYEAMAQSEGKKGKKKKAE